MSYRFDLQLSAESRALIAHAQTWPAAAVPALLKAVDQQNQLTIGHASLKKLSKRGPKTLGVRTNRLRSSLNAPPAVLVGDAIASSLGTNVVYAGAHEFGYKGTVQVAAFTRTVNTYAGGVKSVATLTKAGRIVKKKSKILSSTTQQVKAHERKMNLPERSFLRSSLSERSADYSAALSTALITALRPGSS